MVELLALILSTSLGAVLGLFVLLKNTKSATHRTFFFLTMVLAAWSVANYISVNPIGLSQLWWARLVLFFAALLNLAVFLAFDVFPRYRAYGRPLWRWIAVGMTAVAMAIVLTPLVFVRLQDGNPVVAPGIVVFLLQTVLLLVGAVAKLIRRYRRAHGIEKQQFKYVIFGLSSTFSVIVLTNFVLVAFAHTTVFLPLGATYTLFFTGAFAYAVVRHHLLDIRAVVARSVAYVLLLVALGTIYGFVIFGITSVFFPNQLQSTVQQIVYIVLAVVLAFTFQPLKRFFEQITDRIFFRDRYDTQEVLNQIGQILVSEFKLDRLLPRTLQKICEELSIASGQLYIFDDERIYKVEHYGSLPAKLITAPHLKSFHHRVLVADELAAGHEQTLMQEFGYRVVLHLDTKEEFVGYLLLSDKLSGDIYTPQDIALLEILVQELAVAISNAKAYEDIARFNVTLQQKIDDATHRLKIANQDLQELDEAKDEFISMASHQLRTPLTSIKGYLSMVLEGDAGKISPQQNEFLTYAFSGTQRTVNMIADLLNVSRMTAGKFMIERAEVDLTKLVGEEVQQLQQMAESRQLTLKFVPPKRALPVMQLDEGKTRQVVMNFVDNALHYTKKGEVLVSLRETKGCAELRVKDSGIGVPKDAQKHLFSKFFRAGNAQTARPDGTGLGLFLAKRVVEDQGGTIIFESAEGKGSTFGFSMPLIFKEKESHGSRKQPAGK